MRILVTGGSGFLGGNVVGFFREQGKPYIDILDVVPPDYDYYDIARYINWDMADNVKHLSPYDVVFHCAGILGSETTFADVKAVEKVNVLGTLTVLDLQRDKGVIFQPGLLGNWLNPYMISKRTAERYGLMYRKWYGTEYVSVRFTDIYGPRQSTTQKKITPTFVINALRNEPLPIYGDGSYRVRLLYVEDVARILISMAMKKHIHEPLVDVGSLQPENDITVLDYAKRIIEMTSSASEIKFLPMRIGQPETAGYADGNFAQTGRLFDLLELSETPLELGLQRTISWYESTICD